jgi:hypothetical protein
MRSSTANDLRAPALLDRLLARLPRHRLRSLRPRHHRPPVGEGFRPVSVAKVRLDAAFEFFQKIRAPFWCFHDRDIAPRAARSPSRTEPRPDRRPREAAPEGHRREAPLGHRQPLLQPALHVRRGHQPRRPRLRLRRRAGEEGPRGHQGARRRKLRLLGRPRGLRDAPQHQPEARAGPPRRLPAHGRRLRQEHRLQGPVPHRAQAEGADQAPVRLRRRQRHRLPPHLRPREALQVQHRDQPRHARRPHLPARDRGRRRRKGMLGSIDANTGDLLLGWDTDQFNTDVKELTLAMVSILRAGGLGTGGFNFDAKLRRPSIDPSTSSTPTSAAWTPTPWPSSSPADPRRRQILAPSSPTATPASTPAACPSGTWSSTRTSGPLRSDRASAKSPRRSTGSRVRGIGVSGQQHGFVPLDAHGDVIRPAKLWCDTSTTAECAMLTKKLGGPKAAIRKTGLIPARASPRRRSSG